MTAVRTVVLVAVLVFGTACRTPPPPVDNPPPPTSTAPVPEAEEVTAEGVVRSGVEAGCLLLDTGTVDYLLLGGDRDVLRPDRSVRVRGTPRPDAVTTCQQGVPLEVREAWPA
jgi:hypothetical protein